LSRRDTSISRSNGGRGVAAEGLRRHNLGLVVERIHLQGKASRSELTAATGLNRSTIGDLIGELTARGLVEELPGAAAAGPGRPSPLVRARPQGAAVLGLEISVDSIAAATSGLGGHVFERSRVARPRGRSSPEETVHDVAELARPLLARLPPDHHLAGIGAAVVGVVRRSDGFVHVAPNLGWRDVALGAMLIAELGVDDPVLVANDADLGALAEHRRVHPEAGHLIYVSGEVGIGIGVILDGKPLLGSAGYAGEAGHTLINPGGMKCRCGAVGCWETEAGEAALLRRAGLRGRATGMGVVESLVERAGLGDEATLHAIDDVGRWLGLGLGNLINLFNPQLVVLGGLYQRLFPFLESPVREAIRLRALTAPGESATVVASGLGSDAALIGAAELALTTVIEDPARVGRIVTA
jgi:predicted NBD/HSP70 family sugar kinase